MPISHSNTISSSPPSPPLYSCPDLLPVEARVAVGGVALAQVLLGNVGHAPEAFGYVVPRHLHVEAPRPGPQCIVHVEKRPELGADRAEVSRLVPVGVVGDRK